MNNQSLPVVKKSTWNMTISTDKKLEHNSWGITILLKEGKEWIFIDITVPGYENIVKTQNGKLDRHQELAFDLKPIYQASKVSIIPIGKISTDTKTWQETLGNSNII